MLSEPQFLKLGGTSFLRDVSGTFLCHRILLKKQFQELDRDRSHIIGTIREQSGQKIGWKRGKPQASEKSTLLQDCPLSFSSVEISLTYLLSLSESFPQKSLFEFSETGMLY